jgi:BRCT domain type II-containing protein
MNDQLFTLKAFQQGNEFFGKKVVFAGDLEMMGLNEAHTFVLKLGGEVSTGINTETDILVVGENPEWSIMEQIEDIDRLRETPIILMEELEFVTIIDKYFDLGNVNLD